MSDHNFEVQTIQVDRRGVIPVGPQVSLRRLPLLRATLPSTFRLIVMFMIGVAICSISSLVVAESTDTEVSVDPIMPDYGSFEKELLVIIAQR